ncbi:TetR/AcrR family transcriptional regulator [Nocardiopsis sp. LOL_012]|uniref:TetR/AcrR family transcriptional regulator n=1 Tax=Nocardiopsis sp. LOL_012 TaxID=3345409 RepID=UPI003A83E6BD
MPDVKHFDPDAVLETVAHLFWRLGVDSTGIQDVVAATGLNRSSLYATFGGKQELYLSALHRYLELRSRPMLRSLAGEGCGLETVAEFFSGLVEARCSGEYARWGCMVSNAHLGAESSEPGVRAVLERHHRELREAMHTALAAAEEQGQLAAGVDPSAYADVLVLLAYGINLRSRAGAAAETLHRAVEAALAPIAARSVASSESGR